MNRHVKGYHYYIFALGAITLAAIGVAVSAIYLLAKLLDFDLTKVLFVWAAAAAFVALSYVVGKVVDYVLERRADDE